MADGLRRPGCCTVPLAIGRRSRRAPSGEAHPITQFKGGNIFEFDGSTDVVRSR